MKTSFSIRVCASLVAFLALSCFLALGDVVPVLHTKTESYQNVTLISRTATHVFVQHSRGVATIKLADLDAEALKGLGVNSSGVIIAPAASKTAPGGVAQAETSDTGEEAASTGAAREKLRQSMAPLLAIIAGVWLVAMLVCVLVYVFYVILVRMICKKAGTPAAWWVWVPFPVLQRYALLKAAGMSWWWIGGTIALNVAAGFEEVRNSQAASLGVVIAWVALFITEHVVWSVKIAKARGKGVMTVIALIIPFTFPIAFMYLAFSDGGAGAEADEVPPVKSVQTEPLPA